MNGAPNLKASSLFGPLKPPAGEDKWHQIYLLPRSCRSEQQKENVTERDRVGRSERERERVQDSTHLFIGVTGLAARGNNNIWNIYLTPDVPRKTKALAASTRGWQSFQTFTNRGGFACFVAALCRPRSCTFANTHTDTQGRGGYFMVVFGAVSVLLAERGRFSVSEIIS